MKDQTTEEYTSAGTLIVSVFTAGGAVPIEGAMVTVSGGENKEGVIKVIYTDQSGNTPKILLPAPPAYTSESPGYATPFAKYNIEIEKENFYPRNFINVPIFSDTTSIQPANLIPKTEYEGEALIPENMTVTESQKPNL